MGHHEAGPATWDAIVSDYVTGRARELIRQFDAWNSQAAEPGSWQERAAWMGAAAEILRELTRDA